MVNPSSPSRLPHQAALKLRQYRKHHGLTQEALASQLRLGRSIVARWEIGTRFPSQRRMAELAELGACEPNDWFKPALEAIS